MWGRGEIPLTSSGSHGEPNKKSIGGGLTKKIKRNLLCTGAPHRCGSQRPCIHEGLETESGIEYTRHSELGGR